jgi:hypothetical protein
MADTGKPDDIPDILPLDSADQARPSRGSEAPSPPRGAIAFKDFLPRQKGTKPALFGLVQAPIFEDLEDAVARANRWLARTGLQALSVETVLLPNVQETDQSTVTTNRSDFMDSWRQFVRVWYLQS